MTERTCSVDGCEKVAVRRGWCSMHYQRWRRDGTTELVVRPRKPGRVRPRCTVDGCERPHQARGFCKLHYERWRRTGVVDHVPINVGRECAVEGCRGLAHAGGYCATHYARWKKHGSTDHPHPRRRAPGGQHWCSRCQAYKPQFEFYANGSRRSGLADQCKACAAEAHVRWRKSHPEWFLEQRLARRSGVRGADTEAFTRAEIADRDRWLCQICLCLGRSKVQARIGKSYRWPHPRSLSLDHLRPVTEGGRTVRDNVQASHLACNCWVKRTEQVGQLRIFT